MTFNQLEVNVLRAALRWHYYRERYAPLKVHPKYPGLGPLRFSYDHHWEKLEELEQARDAAVAALAKARRKGRKRAISAQSGGKL